MVLLVLSSACWALELAQPLCCKQRLSEERSWETPSMLLLAGMGPVARTIHKCCCMHDGCCRLQDKSSSFRLMGFGHRVYKTHDPRAKVMQQVCNTVLRIRGQQYAPPIQNVHLTFHWLLPWPCAEG